MFEETNKTKDVCQVDNATQEERVKIRDSILDIIDSVDVKDSNFYIETTMRWLGEHADGRYLGCYVNKLGDVVVALYSHNAIYLLGEAYRTIMYAPKLIFHTPLSGHIHIDDVLVKHNNVGNGSAVMAALLVYAEQSGVKKITGSLSSVDDDHKSRREAYYTKFGFSVNGSTIIKEL